MMENIKLITNSDQIKSAIMSGDYTKMTKITDADFYNKFYDKIFSNVNFDITYWCKELQECVGKRILIVGCGFGRIAIPLINNGHNVTCIEKNQTIYKIFLERVQALNCKNIESFNSNFFKFDFVNKKRNKEKLKYDVILFPSNFFQLLKSHEKIKLAVSRSTELLNHNGIILFDFTHYKYKPSRSPTFAFSYPAQGFTDKFDLQVYADTFNPKYINFRYFISDLNNGNIYLYKKRYFNFTSNEIVKIISQFGKVQFSHEEKISRSEFKILTAVGKIKL